MKPQVEVLDRAVAGTGYLAGDSFTLADINILPMLFYVNRFEEGKAMLGGAKNLSAYMAAHFEGRASRPRRRLRLRRRTRFLPAAPFPLPASSRGECTARGEKKGGPPTIVYLLYRASCREAPSRPQTIENSNLIGPSVDTPPLTQTVSEP